MVPERLPGPTNKEYEMYARNTNDRRHPRRRASVGRLTLVPGGDVRPSCVACRGSPPIIAAVVAPRAGTATRSRARRGQRKGVATLASRSSAADPSGDGRQQRSGSPLPLGRPPLLRASLGHSLRSLPRFGACCGTPPDRSAPSSPTHRTCPAGRRRWSVPAPKSPGALQLHASGSESSATTPSRTSTASTNAATASTNPTNSSGAPSRIAVWSASTSRESPVTAKPAAASRMAATPSCTNRRRCTSGGRTGAGKARRRPAEHREAGLGWRAQRVSRRPAEHREAVLG